MRTGPADAVARDELAAAHLRGGDVDVVVGGLRRVDAQEGRAVAEHLDDALGDALAACSSSSRPALGAAASAALAAAAPARWPAWRRERDARAGPGRAPASMLGLRVGARPPPRAAPPRLGAVLVGVRARRARRLGGLRARAAAARARSARLARPRAAPPGALARRGSRRSGRPCAGGGSRRGRAGRRSRAGRRAGSPPARSGRVQPWMFLLSCGWAVGVPPRWSAAGTRDGFSLAAAAGAPASSARHGAAGRAAQSREPLVAELLGERADPGAAALPRSAARTARKSAAAATSCTRKMCAPASTPWASAASVPARRSRGGAAGERADEVLARDRHQQRAAQLVQAAPPARAARSSARGVLAKSGPGSTISCSRATPRRSASSTRAREERAAPRPTTSS